MSNPLERFFGPQHTAQASAAASTPAAPALAAPPPTRREEDAAKAELFAEAATPDLYRPYITRARPLLGFAVIEKDGKTLHGFQYHTMRHPKQQERDGKEYLSLAADGMALVIEGRGLAIVFRALMRHTLLEIREYDGKESSDPAVHISLVGVVDPRTLDEDTRADLF